MTEIEEHESIEVFIGIDVGKNAHHAVALDRSGRRLFDRGLPNDETKLRALIDGLREHGKALLVVDQPASIGRSQSPLHATRAFLSPICRVLRCVASLTCTPARPRLTRVTRT